MISSTSLCKMIHWMANTLFLAYNPAPMAIIIKTPEEIEKMRVAGRLAAEVLEMIEPHVHLAGPEQRLGEHGSIADLSRPL